jgi:glycosyltransferase involved in cell wall biosynthesis
MIRIIFLIMIALSGCSSTRSDTSLRAKSNKEQTICLNMIVKNEAEVIRRCLDSVKDVIDTWVIMDTGSKDGTQNIIRAHLKDIPGKLYERPWKNWGETRSEAFELAKGRADYILFMDADDVLEFTDGPNLPKLTEDVYYMWRGNDSFSYLKQQLVKGDLPWRWVGVTHEYLDCDQPYTSGKLDNVRYITLDDGASRSHGPSKFLKNVELLQDGLKKEPKNTRYMFYLAESYYDAGEKAKALEWYQKRIDMGGWEVEEIFWSKFRIATILKSLKVADHIVIEAFKDAIAHRPHRPEPYYYIAEFCNSKQDYKTAYEYLEAYNHVKQPPIQDYLFYANWIQNYGLLFQRSICAYYMGHYEEAIGACDQLMANKQLPEDWRKLAQTNRQFPVEKLKEVSLDKSGSNKR